VEEVTETEESGEHIEETEGGVPEETPIEPEAPTTVDIGKYQELELSNEKLKTEANNFTLMTGYFDKAQAGDPEAIAEITKWMGGGLKEETPQTDALADIASEYGEDLSKKIESLIEQRVNSKLEASGIGNLKQESATRLASEHQNHIATALSGLEKIQPGISKAYESNNDFKTVVANLGGLSESDSYQVKALRLKAAYNFFGATKPPTTKQTIDTAKQAATLRPENRTKTTLKSTPTRKLFSETFNDRVKAGEIQDIG
jgi:hypothetical protein